MRSRSLGANPIFSPVPEIVHHGGQSDRVRAAKVVKLYDAELRIARDHFTSLGYRLSKSAVVSGVLLRNAAERLLQALGRKNGSGVWREVWSRRDEWWNPE